MKCGLKTIPLSVDDSDEIKLIETEFGLKGWAVMIKLQQFIARHGYYIKWDIDTQLLFIRDMCLTSVGRSCVSEVVAAAVRRGVFDSAMYEKHGILTSKRIQETFLTATKRSTKVVFDKDYALPIVYDFIKSAHENGKSVNIFFKNDCSFAQKKGKERKGNTVVAGLSDEDYTDLCDKIGQADADYYIERVKAFRERKPTASFSVKATILKWHREDREQQGKEGQNKATNVDASAQALNRAFEQLKEEDL